MAKKKGRRFVLQQGIEKAVFAKTLEEIANAHNRIDALRDQLESLSGNHATLKASHNKLCDLVEKNKTVASGQFDIAVLKGMSDRMDRIAADVKGIITRDIKRLWMAVGDRSQGFTPAQTLAMHKIIKERLETPLLFDVHPLTEPATEVELKVGRFNMTTMDAQKFVSAAFALLPQWIFDSIAARANSAEPLKPNGGDIQLGAFDNASPIFKS